ncbi:MAG: helix-turn-helix domain-containing protein [Acidobacteriota bacterium]
MSEVLISTTEAAKLLGASPSSVKRWADAGLLRCVKTPGRHRRFDRAEVERFGENLPDESPGGATVDPVEAPSDPRLATWLDLLLASPSPRVVEDALLEECGRLGSWGRVADRLGQVLGELGMRWAEGSVSILEEHQVSDRLARALARVTDGLPVAADAPIGLLAMAEGDDHTLGLQLVELCLREAGWHTRWVGARSPIEELKEYVTQERVQLLAVSASSASIDGDSLRGQATELEVACQKAGALLLLGGTGHWPEDLRHARVVRRLSELRALVARDGTKGK